MALEALDTRRWKNYRSALGEQGKQLVVGDKTVAMILRSQSQPPSKKTEYLVIVDDQDYYIHGLREAKALVYELLLQRGIRNVRPV